jgi:hypothetical protein
MKNRKLADIIIAIITCVMILLVSCDNITGSINNSGNLDDQPNIPILITYEVILDKLYNELINRIGIISSDDYTGPTGDEMGQIVNCQYVYNVIKEYSGKNLKPTSGTPLANMEYLLKRVDEANDNSTSYGTGIYATKQLIDTVAVNNALKLIKVFQDQTWSTPGIYEIEIPAGTYRMTAVGGKGGNNGGKGGKGEQVFTIVVLRTLRITVGGIGGTASLSGGKGGSGGTPGNGNPGTNFNGTTFGDPGGGGGGASGIAGYYYVGGGGGSGGVGQNNMTGDVERSFGQDGGGILTFSYAGYTWEIPNTGVGGKGASSASSNVIGGDGGDGGTLDGIGITGTATTESAYVKLERI